MSQPPTSSCSTPMLEKHRIVGSLRERTIYYPMSSRITSEAEEPLNVLAAKVSEHFQTFLSVHQSYIEAEIAELEEMAQKKMNELEEMANGIAKLRKMISRQTKGNQVRMHSSIW